ncbi:hypothetical protein N656DRAFT_127137 [Canariomyces notabilis]|uniref:Uncharacterized protein n=1 Tax=Canariomyces notabilis TaxID=2074819 RepID=A0AAN6TCI7_9PEZI|nr:hypothetical protein N656DRAFT_127137 [Canariomyces arenarius]
MHVPRNGSDGGGEVRKQILQLENAVVFSNPLFPVSLAGTVQGVGELVISGQPMALAICSVTTMVESCVKRGSQEDDFYVQHFGCTNSSCSLAKYQYRTLTEQQHQTWLHWQRSADFKMLEFLPGSTQPSPALSSCRTIAWNLIHVDHSFNLAMQYTAYS